MGLENLWGVLAYPRQGCGFDGGGTCRLRVYMLSPRCIHLRWEKISAAFLKKSEAPPILKVGVFLWGALMGTSGNIRLTELRAGRGSVERHELDGCSPHSTTSQPCDLGRVTPSL